MRTAPSYGDEYIHHAEHAGTFTVVGISEDGNWYKLYYGLYITTGKQYVEFTASSGSGTASSSTASDVPFKVKAKKSVPIRRGAGAGFAQFAVTGVGTFTIVEEKNGFGLLKTYQKQKNGWICLSDVTRV